MNPNLLVPAQSEVLMMPVNRGRFKKFLIIIIGILLLLSLAGLAFFFLYSRFFLNLSTLQKLNFDSAKAVQLLQDPQTLAFTRQNDLYLGNLQGEELLVVPQETKLNNKIANLRISPSRKFITWQSEMGILGLNIDKRKVFRVYKEAPRQSFDLSPIEDRILFLTVQKLLEADLSNGFIKQQFSLPKLGSEKIYFNHASYAPNGKLAYIRSIHEATQATPQNLPADIIINLVTKQFSSALGNNFSDSVSLAPIWSGDSGQLIAWRPQRGLISYDLNTSATTVVIGEADFPDLASFAISPDNKSIIYKAYFNQISTNEPPSARRTFTNSALMIYDQEQNTITSLLTERQLQQQSIPGQTRNLGWLNQDLIWFTLYQDNTKGDLWVIDRDSSSLTKVMENLDQHSLNNVDAPITQSYTLY